MNGLALFAGVGGLDLGINLLIPSSRTVCFIERDAYAASVLRAKMEEGRLHKAPIWSDVTTFDGRPFVETVDYISAGFPCQPWSVAGHQNGTDDERWLWDDIKRIICEVRPRFIFLENVPGLIMGGLDPILRDLAQIGFNAEWGMLKASSVGARHTRKRFFLFGYVQHSSSFGRAQLIFSQKPSELGFISGGPDQEWRRSKWWLSEPAVGRVVDGVANRMDRIRACGNGVVPLQAGVAYSILINRAIERGGLNGN